MSSLDLEALKALVIAACEGDDPAEVGCWVRRGEVEHRLRAARGETFSLSYHRVEPEWSDGDVEILCEVDVHADYIAAMGQKGHVAEFGATEFSLEHPLACRAAGLLNCELHRVCSALDASPVALPGRYLVDLLDGELVVLGPEEVTG